MEPLKKSPKRCGSLTFEWIVITTLLVIGVISGLGMLRSALNTTATLLPENVCEISTGISENEISTQTQSETVDSEDVDSEDNSGSEGT
ncbi:MAG: hypothetical protein Q4C70_05895 [Planctomycetia bacterium]|nr:hypothetical protein [Planctomycetia bacterium]